VPCRARSGYRPAESAIAMGAELPTPLRLGLAPDSPAPLAVVAVVVSIKRPFFTRHGRLPCPTRISGPPHAGPLATRPAAVPRKESRLKATNERCRHCKDTRLCRACPSTSSASVGVNSINSQVRRPSVGVVTIGVAPSILGRFVDSSACLLHGPRGTDRILRVLNAFINLSAGLFRRALCLAACEQHGPNE
jgi:hypothetical protein